MIEWAKKGVGFGQLTMIWDEEKQVYIIDTECMATDHVIDVFKAVETDKHPSGRQLKIGTLVYSLVAVVQFAIIMYLIYKP